ncbi:MAG TPA: SDR family oxidoreductase [Streptosporangiaceae bacterium]|nr:SDR family oxidoreductase [Streptosporangiaceae bacterium]
MTFQPRHAIVTASGSGIGRATAVALAGAGLNVGITWHTDEADAEDTAEEVRQAGVTAEVARLDTTDLSGCGDVVDELAGRLGGVDVFVNNAGAGTAPATRMALDLTLHEWRHVLVSDLDGAFACIQRAGRRMVGHGQGGRLIAVTGGDEHQPRAGSAAGHVAEQGLGGLMRTLALELDPYGITANCVTPGAPGSGGAGRAGDAREVAAVIAFLASPRSAHVTGVSYVVDEGHAPAGSALISDYWPTA